MIREHKICIRLNESEQHILDVICTARALSPSEAVRDLMRDEWKKLIETGQVVLARNADAPLESDVDGEVQGTEEQ